MRECGKQGWLWNVFMYYVCVLQQRENQPPIFIKVQEYRSTIHAPWHYNT